MREQFGIGSIEECTNDPQLNKLNYQVKDKVLARPGFYWVTHYDAIYADEVPNCDYRFYISYWLRFKEDSKVWERMG